MSVEKRKFKRVRKNLPSQVFTLTDQFIVECVIVDLSEGGARLTIAVIPEVVPDYFKLKIGSISPKCRVRWRKGNDVGVEFYE